jgi:hypothetical protein
MLNDWWSKVRFACGEETQNCKVLEEQGCVYYSHRCVNQGCTQVEYTYRCGQGGLQLRGSGQVHGNRVR